MVNKNQRIAELIANTRAFRFCGPSDDPDEQTAVCVAYRHLVTQLQRLAAPVLPETERLRLNAIDIDIHSIYSVYEANAELESLLFDIEFAIENVDVNSFSIGTAAQIIDMSVITKLESVSSEDFDTSFLVRLCKEINSSFAHGNVVSTVLTMRAILNYVPPLFGHTNFEQVTANATRTLKSSLTHLQDGLRKIADFHAHRTINKFDVYPSSAQVDPYKPQFELLLLEVLSRLEPVKQPTE